MSKVFDTTTAGTALEDKQRFWYRAIQSSVYELDISFGSTGDFRGMVENCVLGDVHWTRVKSAPLHYQRNSKHCDGRSPQILLCVPLVGQTEFEQFGRQITCPRGHFMLEHNDSPYRFSYNKNIDLWAIRIPEEMLRIRLRSPERFCAMSFDGKSGVTRFLLDYLDAIAGNILDTKEPIRALIGKQLVDLLAAALENDDRVLNTTSSTTKAAHLARIERYLRKHLSDSDLSAQKVASACGISVRYLHLLFEESGWTMARWIREHRLELAREMLRLDPSGTSISQIAYQLGFSDHAQFSKAFRKKFDCTPSDMAKRREVDR